METLNKPCELDDFTDPELINALRVNLGSEALFRHEWPIGNEDRKFWEIAMAIIAFQRYVPPTSRGVALGVGAGTEPTTYILTNFFSQVIATDLYGHKTWKAFAPALMLAIPERYAGAIPFNRRRLIVQHMSALDLRIESESIDFIYSSSSIEHVGGPDQIALAAREMGRVLKPGGILSLSTELRVNGSAAPLSGTTYLFDREHLDTLVRIPSGCWYVDPPSYSLSAQTLNSSVPFRNEPADVNVDEQHILKKRWSQYPHIVLSHENLMWTSIHVALKKP